MLAERKPAVPAPKPAESRILGVPAGRFGLFATCLLSLALGLVAFCASCFLSIIGLLFYNQLGHHSVDFADTYRYVAFPLGLAVTVISFLVLTTLWVGRKLRGI